MKNWLKKNIESLVVLLLVVSLCILGILLTRQYTKIKLQVLEERIRYTEGYYDDYIELLEEIYRLEIDNAVYEERIKWLEDNYNEKPVLLDTKQMYVDLADFSELAFNFEGSEPEFQAYMLTYHNELYQRILLYQKLFGWKEIKMKKINEKEKIKLEFESLSKIAGFKILPNKAFYVVDNGIKQKYKIDTGLNVYCHCKVNGWVYSPYAMLWLLPILKGDYQPEEIK